MWDAGLWGAGWGGDVELRGCVGGVKAIRKKVDNKVSAFLIKNPNLFFLRN